MFHGDESPCRCRCCIEDALEIQGRYVVMSTARIIGLDRRSAVDVELQGILDRAERDGFALAHR